MQFIKLVAAYRNKFFPPKLKQEQVNILGKQLLLYRGTAPAKADKDDAWFFEMAKHHDVIFDIGCNMGYSSLLASITSPERKILLADPNIQALQYAEANLANNSMSTNKTFLCCFVGDVSKGKIKFYTVGTGAAGSMYGSHAVSAKAVNAWTWVSTETVDDIVAKTGMAPDLVKIDVEAAESKVIQGAVNLAALQKTKFFVEMHGPREMPMVQNAILVLDWCKANNYTAYYLRDHCKLENAGMIADRGRCHLLLLPAEMEYPAYLKNIHENDSLPSSL